ncbi:helix-turn-helix domain-containing protein [Mycobacterium sp.]|uniref:helix-turn-helix domain-containing protein n=1 Tax=Mycobacterium sp. TaxID=1785 RepID=UPI0028BDC315|nr:helix-turn-helix domain-containing protein [Mycobacterium sp.]
MARRDARVRSAKEFEAVQCLIAIGLNDCAIARQTGISRRTVWDWRYCRSPIRARGPNATSATQIVAPARPGPGGNLTPEACSGKVSKR